MEVDQCFRCNTCFSGQDKNKNSPFSLTSCGHIFCRKCLIPGERKCRYCNRTTISSMALTDSVSAEVKYIFQPLERSFEKLRSAFIFQKTQSQITHQHLVDLEKKHAFMSSHYLHILRENSLLKVDLKLTHESLNKHKNCFIEKIDENALRGNAAEKLPSTLGIPDGAQRHVSFVNPQNLVVQTQLENGMIAQTPANQRLHRLNIAPVIIKKSKRKKCLGEIADKKIK